MKVLFLRANSVEKVGIILKTSPIPKDLSKEDKQSYQEVLEEKSLEAMDKALPLYEQAIEAAAQMGIDKSPWLDKIRARIQEINPSSAALTKQITPRVVKAAAEEPAQPAAQQAKKEKKAGPVTAPQVQKPVTPVFHDDAYQRNMKRIENIISMEITPEDKIKQLKRIELEAQRDIGVEEEKIQELKSGSGNQ